MIKPVRPKTLKELARVLARHGARALVVPEAEPALRTPPKAVVVDISKIPSFSRLVNSRGEVSFGSGITLGQLLHQVDGENGLLKQALSMLANPLIRNRITVLEALGLDSPYFDLATALVTLGAKVRLQSPGASRTLSMNDFLLEAAEGLKKGEFPAKVDFTAMDSSYRVGFFRVNPGTGKPTVSASIRSKLRRNVALNPEIVVSSSTVIPIRAQKGEKALNRQTLTDVNVKVASEASAAEMIEISHLEEDDAYERSLIEVAVSRAIRRLQEGPPLIA